MTHEPHIARGRSTTAWRTSSYSGGQGNCIEVADSVPSLVSVRDSKLPASPVLAFGRKAWLAFMDHLN